MAYARLSNDTNKAHRQLSYIELVDIFRNTAVSCEGLEILLQQGFALLLEECVGERVGELGTQCNFHYFSLAFFPH